MYVNIYKMFQWIWKEIEDSCILNGKHVGTYSL
jgi:hypothetical protein